MVSSSPTTGLPRYNRRRSYRWNCQHAPEPVAIEVPAVPGSWQFCGLPVGSPLGVAAGPLLNGRWCRYYASLGFDVLTYKTVRSGARRCYPMPNLQPVRCGQLFGGEHDLPAERKMQGSWAVSFGMPSLPPEVWRADVRYTRRLLPPDKLLSVSVVGTVQPGGSIDQLAEDYARCARWAVQSGADCVETNFSCPNVATQDGQLYRCAADAARVARRVREAIGQVPYICKIGHLADRDAAAALVDQLAPWVDALAMTNSIAATVVGPDGRRLFDGQRRGICGAAIRQASLQQVEMMAGVIGRRGCALQLIGVGGVFTAGDVQRYLDAGAHAVHLATAPMVDPAVGIAIRRQLGGDAAESGGAEP